MCAFKATPGSGTYGTDVVLQPSVTTQTVPGDKFDIQQYDLGTQTWEKYGEGLTVEDTGTIDPLYILVDESLAYPAIFRSVFLPKFSGNTTAAVSDPVVVMMRQHARTAVTISAPKVAARNKTFAVSCTVRPDSGVGKVFMRVRSPQGKVIRSARLTTDEFGYATTTFRATKPGRYTIEMQWLGNRFGVASAVAAKSVQVR